MNDVKELNRAAQATPTQGSLDAAALLKTYAISAALFSGSPDALYERHLKFDNIVRLRKTEREVEVRLAFRLYVLEGLANGQGAGQIFPARYNIFSNLFQGMRGLGHSRELRWCMAISSVAP